MALNACSSRFGSRVSYISMGSRAGVFSVVGVPRCKSTLLRVGSSARMTSGGSGISIRTVACCVIRVVPDTPSSSPSCTKSASLGSSIRRASASSGEKVPVRLLWHVRHVRPLPPNFSTSNSLRPSLSRALAHASDTAGLQLRSIWWPGLLLVSLPIAPGFGQAMANRKANTTAAAPRFTSMASSLPWTFPGADTRSAIHDLQVTRPDIDTMTDNVTDGSGAQLEFRHQNGSARGAPGFLEGDCALPQPECSDALSLGEGGVSPGAPPSASGARLGVRVHGRA